MLVQPVVMQPEERIVSKRARTADKAPRPVTVADFASALEVVQASCVQPVESTIEE